MITIDHIECTIHINLARKYIRLFEMQFNERRKQILRILQTNVCVETNKLSEEFNVSPITIRRDFNFLENKGLVTTVYGGAMINRTLQEQYLSEEVSNKKTNEKRQIAKIAAGFIREGYTILLDSGSTVKEIAIDLLTKKDVMVFTNSILVINVLAQARNEVRVISLPGQFKKSSMCFLGTTTTGFLEQVHVDIAFLGITGFSCERGGTIPDFEEAYVKKKMAQVADTTIIVADHWKIGVNSMFSAVALADVDILITGNEGDSDQLSRISSAGVKVIDVSV